MEGHDKSISSYMLLCGRLLLWCGRALAVIGYGVVPDVVRRFQVEEALAHVARNVGLVVVVAEALSTTLLLFCWREAAERSCDRSHVGRSW
jgi:hypothetical protein